MPFRSKLQWRAMHAKYGHKGWVKRWSRKKPYKALPARARKRRGGRRRKR